MLLSQLRSLTVGLMLLYQHNCGQHRNFCICTLSTVRYLIPDIIVPGFGIGIDAFGPKI